MPRLRPESGGVLVIGEALRSKEAFSRLDAGSEFEGLCLCLAAKAAWGDNTLYQNPLLILSTKGAGRNLPAPFVTAIMGPW